MLPLLKNVSSVARNLLMPRRNYYVYIGRPREQISLAEMWGHGLLIAAGILAVPAWVLVHIKEYRGIDKPEAQ